mmetsp:Transcript_16983/g.46991  ORF Transcript_16983/g.46991 Transcript_16983/m.46991 type:complete len:235 (+) Transcript_16983:78-782(+)
MYITSWPAWSLSSGSEPCALASSACHRLLRLSSDPPSSLPPLACSCCSAAAFPSAVLTPETAASPSAPTSKDARIRGGSGAPWGKDDRLEATSCLGTPKASAAAANASAMPRRTLALPHTSCAASDSRHTAWVSSMCEVVVEIRVEAWQRRPISTRPHVSLSCADACCRTGEDAVTCSPSSTCSMPPSKLSSSCACALLCTKMDSKPAACASTRTSASKAMSCCGPPPPKLASM